MTQKLAYFVQDTAKDEEGNYIPCVAIEGQKGYNLTDWEWGKDFKLAEKCAKQLNEEMGISDNEAMEIVLSTMF